MPGEILDARSGELVRHFPGHGLNSGLQAPLIWSPDGRFLIMPGTVEGRPLDGRIALTVVDAETGAIAHELVGPITRSRFPARDTVGPLNSGANRARMLALDPFNGRIVMCPQEPMESEALVAYDLAGWHRELWPLHVERAPRFLAFRPTGQDMPVPVRAGSWGEPVAIDIRNRRDGTLLASWKTEVNFQTENDLFNLGAYSPDGRYLAFGGLNPSGEGAGQLRRADDGAVLLALRKADGGGIFDLAFHPDSSLLVTNTDRGAMIYGTDPARLIGKLTSRALILAQFSPDGSLFFGGASQGFMLEPSGW